jgi:hypothetical protein
MRTVGVTEDESRERLEPQKPWSTLLLLAQESTRARILLNDDHLSFRRRKGEANDA